mmetsp:Transcript_1048/g.2420  ORF Transcript_1048/g.2420 Transcript_1048/m.2420 type:complete len:358 (+) Transcript_1048:52-1125(+)
MKLFLSAISLTLLASAAGQFPIFTPEGPSSLSSYYAVLLEDKGDSYDRTNDGKAIALGTIFGSLLVAISFNPSLLDLLVETAVYSQSSVLALGAESEAKPGKTKRTYRDLIDFARCATRVDVRACDLLPDPADDNDEGELMSPKFDSLADRANDGKAIAIGTIFGSLIFAVSRNPSLSDTLISTAIYGQASVLALGPESEANVHKSMVIFEELIEFAGCAMGGNKTACDELSLSLSSRVSMIDKKRLPFFSDVNSWVDTKSSSYDKAIGGKATALGVISTNLSYSLSRNPSIMGLYTPISVYGQASVLALGPESEANIGKAAEVYLKLIESHALDFKSQDIGKAINLYVDYIQENSF